MESIKTETVTVFSKKSLNKFIEWTTTKYNDYLGYGTKKEAVLTAYYSLLKGYEVKAYVYTRGMRKGEIELRENLDSKIVMFQCSSPCGENSNGKAKGRGASNRYWTTKTIGEEYEIDCVNKTITAKNSQRKIKFA